MTMNTRKVFIIDTLTAISGLSYFSTMSRNAHKVACDEIHWQECLTKLIAGCTTCESVIWTNASPESLYEFEFPIAKLVLSHWAFVKCEFHTMEEEVDVSEYVERFRDNLGNGKPLVSLNSSSLWLGSCREYMEPYQKGDYNASSDSTIGKLDKNANNKLSKIVLNHEMDIALGRYMFHISQRHPATIVNRVSATHEEKTPVIGTHPLRSYMWPEPKYAKYDIASHGEPGYLLADAIVKHLVGTTIIDIDNLGRVVNLARKLWFDWNLNAYPSFDEIDNYISNWRAIHFALGIPSEWIESSLVKLINLLASRFLSPIISAKSILFHAVGTNSWAQSTLEEAHYHFMSLFLKSKLHQKSIGHLRDYARAKEVSNFFGK